MNSDQTVLNLTELLIAYNYWQTTEYESH